MSSAALQDFSRRVQAELYDHLLPFWIGPALDHQHGGWLPWLSNDLRVDLSQPQGLILNTRLLWSFSAVCQARPDQAYQQMAQRAFDVVMNRFWDHQHGGAFWRLDSNGTVLDPTKKTYGQAFYIYALVEFFRAFADSSALGRAVELFELLEWHAFDPLFGGYLEARQHDWSPAADLRLSDKDANQPKSMNNHLHLLEAYTNLYRARKEPRVEQRLRDLLTVFRERILDPGTLHFHHFFDEQWRLRSDTYTFGHDIEGSWLLCEAAEVLGDKKLLAATRQLALQIAETVLTQALDVDGGLCYEGKSGTIIDRSKEWWPQAEALVGFLNAFQLSKQERYLIATNCVWDYIQHHLVDRVHGEWFWRIDPSGKPDPALPKVSEWKDPYHAVRACLEILRRLKEL